MNKSTEDRITGFLQLELEQDSWILITIHLPDGSVSVTTSGNLTAEQTGSLLKQLAPQIIAKGEPDITG